MDSFEFAKIAGAVLFTLLVLTASRIGVDALYLPRDSGPPVYQVALAAPGTSPSSPAAKSPGKAVAGTSSAPTSAKTPTPAKTPTSAKPPIKPPTQPTSGKTPAGSATVFGADPVKGKTIASGICTACHDLSSARKIRFGPPLWGVFGRKKASWPGFSYTPGLKGKGGVWSAKELDAFLTKPSRFAPGTRMSFPGFSDPTRRHDVIAWLATLGHPKTPAAAEKNQAATPAGKNPEKAAAKTPSTTPTGKNPESPGKTPAKPKGGAENQSAVSAKKSPAAAKGPGKATSGKTAAPPPVKPKTPPTPASPQKKMPPVSVEIAAGQQLAQRRCALCHDFTKAGKAKQGPPLWGIVGRQKAAWPGFSYSKAMEKKGGVWNVKELDAFLTKPSRAIAGTKMIFPGLKNPDQRREIIAWLATLTDE